MFPWKGADRTCCKPSSMPGVVLDALWVSVTCDHRCVLSAPSYRWECWDLRHWLKVPSCLYIVQSSKATGELPRRACAQSNQPVGNRPLGISGFLRSCPEGLGWNGPREKRHVSQGGAETWPEWTPSYPQPSPGDPGGAGGEAATLVSCLQTPTPTSVALGD